MILLAVLLAVGTLFSSSARAQVVDTVPSDSSPTMGDTITVNVNVAGVTDLYSISFDLIYSSAVLSYDSTTEGDFLYGGGTPPDPPTTTMQAALLDGAPGDLVVGISRLGGIGGISGSGTLATIQFQVIGDYCTSGDISFSFNSLENPTGLDITATWNGATLDITLSPPTGLAAVDAGTQDQIDLSWTGVTGATEYELQRVTSPSGSNPQSWVISAISYNDTNGVIPNQEYCYQVAAISSGGCYSDYSPQVCFSVAGLTGDINKDGRVDGRDLSQLGRVFGTISGDGKYNSAADLNSDGIIDGEDLTLLTANFGKTQ